MTPGKPIGGRAALAMGHERVVADPELASHVQLGRCRAARKRVSPIMDIVSKEISPPVVEPLKTALISLPS